jgi:hypothetical protein
MKMKMKCLKNPLSASTPFMIDYKDWFVSNAGWLSTFIKLNHITLSSLVEIVLAIWIRELQHRET